MQWFTTVVSAFAASTEPEGVIDIRAKWLSVTKYFHLLHGSSDAAAFEKYRQQLPDIAAHFRAISQHVDEEALVSVTDGGSRPCLNAVFIASKSSDSSIFVHACQIAKCGEPPELAGIAMNFLVDLLLAINAHSSRMLDDVETVTRPFMDVISKLAGSSDVTTTDAVARGVALVAAWSAAVPKLRIKLLPPKQDMQLSGTADRISANAEYLLSFADKCLQSSSAIAYVSGHEILRSLLPRLTREQQGGFLTTIESQITGYALTLCQMPEDTANTMAMLAASIHTAELLCVSTGIGIESAFCDLNAILTRLMQSHDDAVFSRACAVAASCLRHAITQRTIDMLAKTLTQESTRIRIIANFDNVDTRVAVASIRLVTTLFEFSPVSSAEALLELSQFDRAPTAYPSPDDLRCMFSSLAVKRRLCGDDVSAVAEAAQCRCMAIRAVTGSRIADMSMNTNAHPLLIKTLAAKVSASLDETFHVNIACCGLVAALACLPCPAVSQDLFGNDGALSRFLEVCKADIDRLFADSSNLQRLLKAVTVSGAPTEKSVGATIALEYLHQELMAILAVHRRGDEKLKVITD